MTKSVAQWVTVGLLSVLISCAAEPSVKATSETLPSPEAYSTTLWEYADVYLDCLNDAEKRQLWKQLESEGFQQTFESLKLPEVCCFSEINGVGVYTPTGLVRHEEFDNEYLPMLNRAIAALEYASQVPAKLPKLREESGPAND